MEKKSFLNVAVMVAALGYFVDIYDLVLFSTIRIPSLKAIGVENITDVGLYLLNIQMIGMLIGGILWGIIGDKKGRLSVLFGSILLYSLANIGNAFVSNVEQYALLRFIAGIGLAGELGAGITLAVELVDKEMRGWATTFIATIGVSGAVLAGLLGGVLNIDWKICYIIGGLLGLVLLILRVGVKESGMFHAVKESQESRGNILILFNHADRFKRYLLCILMGLPIWYTIGILVTLSPEMSTALHIKGKVIPGISIMACYTGVTLGDLASGILSQCLQSRRKILLGFIATTFVMVLLYFQCKEIALSTFYIVILLLGFAAGYWAVLITSAAEQFGTNIRATATTSIPNFIRASLVIITIAYKSIEGYGIDKLNSALITGIISCGIAFVAAFFLKETFNKDLDYIEK